MSQKIKVKTTCKKHAFTLPVFGPYTNHQRQLLVLWNWFERICNQGDVTWARQEGNPFEPHGKGTLEAGVGNRNAIFHFTVEDGRIVRGVMF